MHIDLRSAVIGLLLGVCLCLGAMLVLTRRTPTAQAAGTTETMRYQIAVGYGYPPYVIDRVTATAYVIKDKHGQAVWKRVIDGPPR